MNDLIKITYDDVRKFLDEIRLRLKNIRELETEWENSHDIDDRAGAKHFYDKAQQDLGAFLHRKLDLVMMLIYFFDQVSELEHRLDLQTFLTNHWRERGQANEDRRVDIDQLTKMYESETKAFKTEIDKLQESLRLSEKDCDTLQRRVEYLSFEINEMRRVMQASGTWEQFCSDYTAYKIGSEVLNPERHTRFDLENPGEHHPLLNVRVERLLQLAQTTSHVNSLAIVEILTGESDGDNSDES